MVAADINSGRPRSNSRLACWEMIIHLRVLPDCPKFRGAAQISTEISTWMGTAKLDELVGTPEIIQEFFSVRTESSGRINQAAFPITLASSTSINFPE
jgi:hypothetical protein